MNKLKILYEDNHIIVVFKEANILSQADDTRDKDLLTIVKQYIKEKYNKPGNVYLGLVHRLDRPVSGIMVFAKTSKASKRLGEQIRNRTMKKTYLAVVNGLLTKNKGKFCDYLVKLNNGNTITTTKDKGKESILYYEVLAKDFKNNTTLVKINLETGRHHQIRVQFASRGYYLCGDQRYGKQDKTPIALCAYKLEFRHPVTKEKLCFKIDKPKGKYWDNFDVDIY